MSNHVIITHVIQLLPAAAAAAAAAATQIQGDALDDGAVIECSSSSPFSLGPSPIPVASLPFH